MYNETCLIWSPLGHFADLIIKQVAVSGRSLCIEMAYGGFQVVWFEQVTLHSDLIGQVSLLV